LVTAIGLAAWSRLRIAGFDLAVLVAAEQGGPAAVAVLFLSSARSNCVDRGNCRMEIH
jgi:uncharacterized membrane protein